MQTWVLMKMSKAGSITGTELLWPSGLPFTYSYNYISITFYNYISLLRKMMGILMGSQVAGETEERESVSLTERRRARNYEFDYF